MNLKFLTAGIALAVLAFNEAAAENSADRPIDVDTTDIVLVKVRPGMDTSKFIMTSRRANGLVPRPAMQPVKSIIPGKGSRVIDTLSTSNPAVSIVLCEDNTWKYVRNPEAAKNSPVFSMNWNDVYANPYGVELKDLPAETTIWLVDSLKEYVCPNQVKVYSPFGIRHGRRHMGVDLPLKTGTPVYAAFSGKVRMSKYMRGFGNLVVLRHENGLETFYGHLSKRNVEEGDWVSAGDVIGLGGSTGRSTGAHLHFETRYEGYAFDPQWIINFENGDLRKQVFVLKKKYLDAGSKYVPESDDEEYAIMQADSAYYAQEAAKKAELAAMKYYTVRSGDTLSGIAAKNGTSVSAICRLNGITTKTVLKIGRRLRVK